MKKVITGLACLLAISLSIPSWAAPSGLYIEGTFGWVGQSGLPSQTALSATEKTDKHMGGRVAIGCSFELDQQLSLGAELGWGSYGRSDYGSVGPLDSSAIDLQAVGNFYINPQVSLIGKLGLAYSSLKVNNAFTDGNRDEFNVIFGVGMGYDISQNLQFNVIYSHIFGHDVNIDNSSNTATINAVLLGIKYTF
ncbi:outer membrane beta-barrel protein [Piscirickettsia litoralis]|uniref:Outer membrane protein beta-barrel domain-containing protein n=1 Tax=Piscirickettsia litoralis TaxID=1891921 RepID=A0ABX3A0E8_9GAMM|nr:outer membrane beta-barrel protein [Piscirickettsia litoralis]ODN42317.1 hypothetical protein BGC07_04430 [Piscirickettsia litoralis]